MKEEYNTVDVIVCVALGFRAFIVGYTLQWIIQGYTAGRAYVKSL